MHINKFRLAIAILVLAAVILGLMYHQISITANAVKEKQEMEYYESWLPENCVCLEKERIKCTDGFEVINGLCKNEIQKTFTNVMKACSEYKCSDENYVFNQENKKWEIKK